MARAISGRRARVLTVRRLAGGIDAATHAVRLDPGGWIVLKRTGAGGARLSGEFERLRVAGAVPPVTPEPIALDEAGDWFRCPALVMTRVPGRSVIHEHAGGWLDELAAALAAIHATPLPTQLPAALREGHAGIRWRRPGPRELRTNDRVEQVIAVAEQLQRDRDRSPAVLLHHDYHHGNVTWHRGRLAAVVDWNEARLGPPGCDVGYCAVDLSMTHGIAAARRFVAAYERAAGRQLAGLGAWQALWLVNAMRWVGDWATSFEDVGATHLTVAVMRRRLRSFGDLLLRES